MSSCDASRCEKIVGLVADTPNLVGVLGVGAGAVQLQPKKARPDTDKFPIGCDELGGSGASRSSTSSRSRASSSGKGSRGKGSRTDGGTGPLARSASSGDASSGSVISSGRSGNSTAAVSGARGSGGRRQTPNDVSLHAGESRERAVSSQGAAIRNGLKADGSPPCSSASSSRKSNRAGRGTGPLVRRASSGDASSGRAIQQWQEWQQYGCGQWS